MKTIATAIALFFSATAFGQITLEHEFFNSDPEFSGNLYTVYLAPDEMVYASWTTENIFLYDLDYNLTQTIPVAAPEVGYIRYITRSLFDCDPDNIEYMVLSGNFGNTLIEVYREDGTLLEEIPYGHLMTIGTDQSNDLTIPLQSTSEGTKMLIKIIGNGAESTRVYGLCGEYPIPCCMAGSSSITGIDGGTTFRYSTASPNPTFSTTTIQLSLPLSETGVLRLFNASGQEVKNVNVTSGQKLIELNLSEQPAGTYLYRIETPTGVKPTGKVVKQ